MTYVLEKISVSDQEKIILDAAQNHSAEGHLTYAKRVNLFTKSWAIDKQRNSYLFAMPRTMREHSDNRNYYFYFEGVLHRFYLEAWFGNTARLEYPVTNSPVLLLKLQTELTNAFAVYGEHGNGILNELGKPEFVVSPVFKVGV
jgi:hypothetical protein